MSETVLAALEGYNQMRDVKAFKYFLFGIASRKHQHGLRRNKFHGDYSEQQAEAQSQQSNAEAQTDLGLLHQALNHLPHEQKEAIVLFEISGFKLQEIAELQEVSLSAVKQRLGRGREKLACLLNEPGIAKKRNVNRHSPALANIGSTTKNTCHEPKK